MSEGNVETVRRIHEAAARRDASTVLSLYDPAVELDSTRLEIAGGTFQGIDGLRTFFREWHEAWEQIDYDYEELIDAGEHVVSVVKRRARGRFSGAGVELHVALVWTLRDGKVTRLVWYPDRAEALKVAGVP